MKLSYFLQIFLQQSYMHVYNTDFSVETRLEHGFAIENTYFLWKVRFAHYFHYYSL